MLTIRGRGGPSSTSYARSSRLPGWPTNKRPSSSFARPKPWWLTRYALSATAVALALTLTYNTLSNPRLLYLFAITGCLPGIVFIGRYNRWDKALGELSYPIYLIHPLATIIIITGAWGEYIAIAVILALSWVVTQVVERPIDRYRQIRAYKRIGNPQPINSPTGPASPAAVTSDVPNSLGS